MNYKTMLLVLLTVLTTSLAEASSKEVVPLPLSAEQCEGYRQWLFDRRETHINNGQEIRSAFITMPENPGLLRPGMNGILLNP